MVTKEYFDELKESMAKQSEDSLIAEFNQQVGCCTFTSIRDLHDSILVDTLFEKGIDVSAIYDGANISFNHKIKLNSAINKVEIVLRTRNTIKKGTKICRIQINPLSLQGNN